MLLLFCSILLVVISSAFIAVSFASKNLVNYIIYFLLSAFANVVLTFEILSLLSGISRTNVLIVNFVFAVLSLILWLAKKCPSADFDLKSGWKKFLTAIKLDKTILYLFLGFMFTCIVSLVLISFLPGIYIDSTTYRIIRALYWIKYGNLNHFHAADARILMFPINSEILYAWFMLFLKSDLWLFIFNFCGTGLFLTALYGLLSEVTTSLRRKLWVVFIAAAIPFVLVRFTGLDTGVLISALVMCSMYLYMRFMKERDDFMCFMAALALALGVGTKTTVIMLMPALGLWLLWYSFYTIKKDFYRPLIKFAIYFIVSFILFASYNYILNFINYGNFIAATNIALAHSNTDGVLSTFSNLYRYIFDFFSFPEYVWSAQLSTKILTLRDGLLNLLHANYGFGRTAVNFPYVNHSVSTAVSSVGFFGPLLFIPAYIYTIYKSFRVKNRRSLILVSFVYMFLIAVFLMAYKLAFMSFNIRFLTTFILLTVPVISYFYYKKYGFYKIFITFVALAYMFTIPVNISLYPVNGILDVFRQGASVKKLHSLMECTFLNGHLDINNYDVRELSCLVKDAILQFRPENKILYFVSTDEPLMPMTRLIFDGYSIDFALATDIDKINLNDYNIILLCENTQTSSTIFSLNINLDKNGYTYNDGVLCSYLDYHSNIIKDMPIDENQVDRTVCYFNKDFVKIHNLRFLTGNTYIVGRNSDGTWKYKTFDFYENLNNPLVR